MRRRGIKSTALVLLVIFGMVVGVAIAWRADLLKSIFIRLASWQSGRPVDVRGTLHVYLLTKSPRIEAERVTIGNPPWTKPGVTADIAKLTVIFAPLLSQQTGLVLIKIDNAELQFMRDGAGHANWQRVDPDKSSGGPLPIIRAFELTHIHLTLADERLHLVFDGGVSVAAPESADALQMEGAGTLNERPVAFHVKGDALQSAALDKPYAFEFDERSSGTHVTAHGSLPWPLDFGLIDATFDASGADLRDLYYLLGVSLPNTGPFRVQGRTLHRGNETVFQDLKVTTGQSDVAGSVSFDTQKGDRTLIHADLTSTLLRLADVGLRAAGRDPHPDAPPRLFSDVTLVTPAARRVDVVGKVSIRRLLMSHVAVTDLDAPFTIDRGRIEAPKVTGHFMGGNLLANLDTDANQTPARTRTALTLTGSQLAEIPHKTEPPPFDGSLVLHIKAQGTGDSLHALAANAEGHLSGRVVQATMRASLAELTSVDLRGLGLTLTGSKREVAVHCAALDFDIHAGVMHSTRLFIDTDPVFIRGEGRVMLDSETMDLRLHGEPKRLRILRSKAPLLVQGTLMQPKFSIDVADSGVQLIDRGTPQNADCEALLAH